MSEFVIAALNVFNLQTGARLHWSGLCIWFLDDVDAHAQWLLSMGCKWSEKRGQWYWRYEEGR